MYERVITQSVVMKKNFKILHQEINYWSLLLPLAMTSVLWILIAAGGYKYGRKELEATAIVVTCFFVLAAVLRYLITRHNFFLWSTGLMVLILCREIHFEGTDPGIYIGMFMLFVIALLKYDNLKDYLANPLLVNLLLIGFFTYFLSVSIDQRWWKGIPEEKIVHVPLEETLEVLGHCIIGSALVFCKSKGKKLITPRCS
jgi:glucan phosphoethanolaminetransferase (alkaline phosphatase superfamily)